MFRNFVKNSFKSDVALKHAQGERPAKKHTRRAEVAVREQRTQETTKKTSIPSTEHGIVPIPGRLTLP